LREIERLKPREGVSRKEKVLGNKKLKQIKGS